MTDVSSFTGTFVVTGELTQVALNGPPLRLRAEVEVSVDSGRRFNVLSFTVTPQNLASSLSLAKGVVDQPETHWPLAGLAFLHRPSELETWIRRPARTNSCSSDQQGGTNLHFTTSDTGSTHLHTYASENDTDNSASLQISGFVNADADGAVNEASVAIQRWHKLSGDTCDVVQQERVSIVSRMSK